MNFKNKKGWENMFHLKVRLKGMNQETEQPLHNSQRITTDEPGFERFIRRSQAYIIEEVLHTPKGYVYPQPKLKKNAGKAEKTDYENAMKLYDRITLLMGSKSSSPSEVSDREKELKKMTVAELDEIMEDLGLEVTGNKAEKIAAIIEEEEEGI